MDKPINVCLLNDSFPPVIDGVANAVMNYADIITRKYGRAVVATPSYPGVTDNYPFPVVRYPSIDTIKSLGYRTGFPFSPHTIRKLARYHPAIIHAHCPFASAILARTLRACTGAPLIFTYHTKFDIEIKNALSLGLNQAAAIKLIVNNIDACDDVWVVSRGAGENLRGLGYQGDYIVMGNGVDFPRARATAAAIAALRRKHSIGEDEPVFLFVGRTQWYKGIRIILDGLRRVRAKGLGFKMIFVGDGTDLAEIKSYARALGLAESCVFTGAIRDRQLLRVYYSMADMFLLPSTFDNRPIVVLEAAACGLASILIRGSSAAEGVTDGQDGLLIEENAASLARAVLAVIRDTSLAARLGRCAMADLYISWEDAVAAATARYKTLIESVNRKKPDKIRAAFAFNVTGQR
ncbi:glycosyltransferase [Oscillospiraceae bacterium CM]|nr:glycosyltransferase [Oscillospiraceae bacterium CM]